MSGPESPLDQLRSEVATSRGLTPSAASFLDGTTLEQIEAQATALARLLGENADRREREVALGHDMFSIAATAKQVRKQALAAMFTGRALQARDEVGRFATGGFDGGARQSLPIAKSPEQAHGELVGHLVGLRRIYGGRPSF